MHPPPVRTLWLLAASAAASAATAATGPVFWEPSAYLSAADIPAGFYAGDAPSFLDTLEDGTLDGGLSASAGSVIGPGQFDGVRDSVDADDGVIDGSGTAGRSFFSGTGSTGITFTFLGLKVNDRARVQMADGKPSGNIFASGEIMSGNILGQGYLAGFGMTIGTVFGRIAGEEAARHVRN